MRIINGKWPPNIDEIAKVFPVVRRKAGVLLCFDDAIFNPSSVDVPPYLLAHEGVHCDRQQRHPYEWWERYLTDKQFRLQEELFAHAAELQVRLAEPLGRRQRRQAVAQVAQRIASGLYGKMISEGSAKVILSKMAGVGAFVPAHLGPFKEITI